MTWYKPVVYTVVRLYQKGVVIETMVVKMGDIIKKCMIY